MATNILIVMWTLVMIKETKKTKKSEKSHHCLEFVSGTKNSIELMVQNGDKFQRTQLALLAVVFCLEIICKPTNSFYNLVQIGWLDWGPQEIAIYKGVTASGSSLFALIISVGLKKYLPHDLHLFFSLFTSVISLFIFAFVNVGWMFYLGR